MGTCTDEEICVWGDVCRKKYMTLLHELHINQHTHGRHALYLFLSQNVNVRKEVTKRSTDTP